MEADRYADREIVKQIQAGQQQLFSLLVERHQKALLRLCLRFTRNLGMAEDVVQESFIKAYQKIDSFEGRASFKSWLFQIAVNTAKNSLRARKGESVKLDSVQIAVSGEAHSSLEQMDLKELVQKYVDILPEKQRTALVLRIFEDLSFKEIARIMDCPYDTAKANYRHAIMKLRHQFAEDQFLKDWDEPFYEPMAGTNYLEVEQ